MPAAGDGRDRRLLGRRRFLAEQGVGEWMELPLWVASDEWALHEATSVTSAPSQAGLTFRPLEDTVRDTLDCDAHAGRPPSGGPEAGTRGRAAGRVGIASIGRVSFVHRETVRFRDLDAMGHVNNAVYSTFLEQARLAFLEPHGAASRT